MTGSLSTRIARAERLIESGPRGLRIIFVLGGVRDDDTGEHASIIGGDMPLKFRCRADDEMPAEFHARVTAEATSAHATTLIFGGLPLDDDMEPE